MTQTCGITNKPGNKCSPILLFEQYKHQGHSFLPWAILINLQTTWPGETPFSLGNSIALTVGFLLLSAVGVIQCTLLIVGINGKHLGTYDVKYIRK